MQAATNRSLVLHARRDILRSPADVFSFLVRDMPRAYRQLSPAHERFEIEGGGPLAQGSTIDCRETVANQRVHHRYVVSRFEPERALSYASQPTHSFLRVGPRVIEGRCNTYVHYLLEPFAGGTRFDMTIEIEFASRWECWLARVFGRARALWGGHQLEELDNLVSLLESPRLSASV